ncbi:MAG: hypothetical protein OEV94_07755 [Deltaproteobacteria bacterium]|nr:hypothetical protein [Deltaproteobacteria bacterium]
MLYDELPLDQMVDGELAQEFLKEATRLAASDGLEDTGRRLAAKGRMFRQRLTAESLAEMNDQGWRDLLTHVFGLRRRAGALLKTHGASGLNDLAGTLIHGSGGAGERFARFVESLKGVERPFALGLAGELLHYARPDEYWLWAHWMWNPANKTGALPLVLKSEASLEAATLAEGYERVGAAVARVNDLGQREGFSRLGEGLGGTHVFLAAVYAVYMYTLFSMKLSKEFNRILPELPEFTRRVLGVQKLEGNEAYV